jgi:hypothetical protein
MRAEARHELLPDGAGGAEYSNLNLLHDLFLSEWELSHKRVPSLYPLERADTLRLASLAQGRSGVGRYDCPVGNRESGIRSRGQPESRFRTSRTVRRALRANSGPGHSAI